MATPHFHRLNIREIRRESPDAITLAFAVPDQLRDTYRFTAGQFLTLRTELEGGEIRRSYSICCGADEYEDRGELRVAIKRVDGGAFSNWANEALAAGTAIDVMPPDGRFFTRLAPDSARHYAAFAAGSGITPVLSIIKTTLQREPRSRCTLIYGNRRIESILFSEQLEDLKDRYLDRFALYHVLSREHQEVDLFNGRIDAGKVSAFLDTLLPPTTIDEAFVCGPESMIDEVERALLGAGIEKRKIHAERFGTPGTPRAATRQRPRVSEAVAETADSAEVEIVADGMRRKLRVPFNGTAILDAALAAGADLPYACKAGVCCTCRAKVLEGEVRMERNFTLEEHEIQQGYVLTCQSHPVSRRVVVSYDER